MPQEFLFDLNDVRITAHVALHWSHVSMPGVAAAFV
jgi:hypothetical protein